MDRDVVIQPKNQVLELAGVGYFQVAFGGDDGSGIVAVELAVNRPPPANFKGLPARVEGPIHRPNDFALARAVGVCAVAKDQFRTCVPGFALAECSGLVSFALLPGERAERLEKARRPPSLLYRMYPYRGCNSERAIKAF